MRITALEEYGLRCMILLARSNGDALTLSDFGERESLSIPYAGKLLMILRKAKLVKASRGRNGGYTLAKDPGGIYLKDIFDALGEPVFSPSHCQKFTGSEKDCIHKDDCSVKDIWERFGGLIGNVLERITLADVAAGNLDLISDSGIMQKGGNQDGKLNAEYNG